MQVIRACSGAYDAGSEASHRVIHQDGDRTTFKRAGYRFATSNIAARFMQHVSTHGQLAQFVREMFASPRSDAGLRGLIFEAYVHALLVRGGAYECRYLDISGAVAAQPTQHPQLQLEDCEKEVFFHTGSQSRVRTDITGFCNAAKDVGHSGMQSAYLRPSGQGHPLVDSCIYPNTLLQITVAASRDTVDEVLLEEHLACLPDQPQYFLDYVVPHNVYATFKVPKLQRASNHVRVKKTHVRVLKVDVT